jgi:H/ACA ribonucleoprotein complex subunit 4
MDLKQIKSKKTTKELLEFGIINIDKSSGPTSFDVSEFVKKKLELRKTSHFGTLDPKVTGVLPVALNRACKLTGFFLGEDKEYVGIMVIHEDIPQKEVERVIGNKFLGKIKQTPPVKSRVKRQEREREIKKFEILEKDGKNFLFIAECQGGTYIRKLVSDLGENLETGAHMLELRRIRAGIFKENDKNYPIVSLYDFEKAVDKYRGGDEEELRRMIIPAEIVCEVYPIVQVKEDNLKKILTGKPIYKDDLEKREKNYEKDVVCVFCKDRFLGMYRLIQEGELFAKPEFVMN